MPRRIASITYLILCPELGGARPEAGTHLTNYGAVTVAAAPLANALSVAELLAVTGLTACSVKL